MLLDWVKARYGVVGRRRHRANLGRRNELLGYFFALCFGVVALLHVFHREQAPSLAEPNHGRELSGLFKTLPEHCEGTASYFAVPFFAITLYAFVGLAVITDEYFEPTLALISDDLELPKDVAGATFMAIGSSAPELFTSLVDVFFSKSSVGVGTILGSAMFNILVIVGGSAIIGRGKDGKALVISGWPLGRDSVFYLLSLLVLSWTMLNDGKLCVLKDNITEIYVNNTNQVNLRQEDLYCYVGLIRPLEGLLLCLFYVCYILFMVYNKSIHLWYNENISFKCCTKFGRPTQTKPDYDLSNMVQEVDAAHEQQKKREERNRLDSTVDPDEEAPSFEAEDENEEPFDEEEEEFPPNPFTFSDAPESVGGKIYYALAWPYYAIFYIFMPTCMKRGKARNYLLFFVNIVFIGALTMVMTYFATYAGCVLSVDPFIIGVIFLAIGTSVPDLLASLIVARDGHGNMAIANALGSNIFDICVGLGLPWLVAQLVLPKDVIAREGLIAGSFVITNGIVAGMLALVLGLAIFVGGLLVCKMRMVSCIAYSLIAYYVLFLVLIILSNACVIPFCMELDCSRCGNDASLLF